MSETAPSARRPYAVLAVLAFAAALRLYALTDVRLTHDSYEYLDLAREIAAGEFFSAHYPLDGGLLYSRQVPPLFSMLVAVIHLLGVPLAAGGTAIALLADLIAVLLAFRIGRRVAGDSAGLLAGLVAAGSLQHLTFADRILTESLFGMLILATLDAALAAAERPGVKSGAWAGLLAGLCYLTRENGIVLVGLCGLSAAVWYWRSRPPRAVAVRLAAGFCAAWFLAALPFWIEVRARTGHFGLSLRDSVAAQVMSSRRWETDGNGARSLGPAGAILKRAQLARVYLQKGFVPKWNGLPPWRQAYYVRISVNVLLTVLAALIFIIDKNARSRAILLAGWAAGFFFSTILIAPVLFVPRYNYPAVMIVELLAGCGLAALAERAAKIVPRTAALGLATGVVVAHGAWAAGFVRAEGIALTRKSASRGVEEATAMCRPRLDLPASPRVMDAKIFAAYFLDGTFVALPEDPAAVGPTARAANADLIVVDSDAVEEKYPRLAGLLPGLSAPEGFRTACQYRHAPAGKLITFYQPADRPPPVPTAPATVAEMERLLRAGDLWPARQLGERLIAQNPDDFSAHWRMLVLEAVIAKHDPSARPRAEARLAELVRLGPNRPETASARRLLQELSPPQ